MVEISRHEEAFLAPGSRAGELYERARKVMPGGNSRTTAVANGCTKLSS